MGEEREQTASYIGTDSTQTYKPNRTNNMLTGRNKNDRFYTIYFREGVLIIMGEEGELTASYMGTDPTLHSAVPPDTREVNYEETDR